MRKVKKITMKAFIDEKIAQSETIENPQFGFVPHVLESHIVKHFLLDTIGYIPMFLATDVFLQNFNDKNYIFTYHDCVSDILIEIYWSVINE